MEMNLNSLSKSELTFFSKIDRHLVSVSGRGAELSDAEKRRVQLEREASWARASGSVMTLFLSVATIVIAMLSILITAEIRNLSEVFFVLGAWAVVCVLGAGAWILAAPQSSRSYAALMASFVLDQRELAAVRDARAIEAVPERRGWGIFWARHSKLK